MTVYASISIDSSKHTHIFCVCVLMVSFTCQHLESSSMSFSISQWLARHTCCACDVVSSCLYLVPCFFYSVFLLCAWTLLVFVILSLCAVEGSSYMFVSIHLYACCCWWWCVCFVSLCYRDIVFLCRHLTFVRGYVFTFLCLFLCLELDERGGTHRVYKHMPPSSYNNERNDMFF